MTRHEQANRNRRHPEPGEGQGLRLMPPFMLALALASGCADGGGRPRHAPAGAVEKPTAVEQAPAPTPTVSVRIITLRDWDSLCYAVSTEDVDLTLEQALARGWPAELWIHLAAKPAQWRYVVYWVEPIHA